MTRFYMQREAGIRETVSALAVAVGVGGLSYYLVRMLLAREDLETRVGTKVSDQVDGDRGRRQLAGGKLSK